MASGLCARVIAKAREEMCIRDRIMGKEGKAVSKRVLAFDFGASSGRAILGAYADGRIELKEIHRFSNDPVEVNGTLYWDVLRLFHEIKQGITKAVHELSLIHI